MIDELIDICEPTDPAFHIAAPVLQHVQLLHDRLPGWTELSCFWPDKDAGIPPRIYWAKCNDSAEMARITVKGARDNLEGFGLYIGIASRKAPTDTRGAARDAEHIKVLWADVDAKNGSTLEQVLQFEPAPSVVFSSGGGWHPYWLLSYGVKPQQLHKDIMRGLTRHFNNSDNVGDFARVFRCLGSYNTKPGRNNERVIIERYEPELLYTIDDFVHLAEPEPTILRSDAPVERTDMPAWVIRFRNHPPASERNNTLFRIAGSLHDRGWDMADVAAEFVGFGGLPEAESIRTIKSAFNRPRRGQAINRREDLRAAARA